MSIYSGKCDLYDCAVMIGHYDIKKIQLFINKDGRSYPIKLEEPRDLIPYYPYVPYMSTGDSEGNWKAWISESFIDQEESDMLNWQLKDLIREYKKSKRNKTSFSPDIKWYDKRIIERVKEKGEKATIEGLHRNISNHWRKVLAEEMERNGYKDNEIVQWVYPERWLTKFDWRTDEY